MIRKLRTSKLDPPSTCPDHVANIMMACWRIDRNTRIDAGMALAEMSTVYATDSTLIWPRLDDMKDAADKLRVAPETLNYGPLNLDDAAVKTHFTSLEVSASQIMLKKQLGSGAFGAVHLGLLCIPDQSPRRVAVKTVTDASPDAIGKFLVEARLLAALQHENIVEIVGVVTATDSPSIVLELMGSDLAQHLRKHAASNQPAIPLRDMTDVCAQVASAMAFVSHYRVVHRDLAAR